MIIPLYANYWFLICVCYCNYCFLILVCANPIFTYCSSNIQLIFEVMSVNGFCTNVNVNRWEVYFTLIAFPCPLLPPNSSCLYTTFLSIHLNNYFMLLRLFTMTGFSSPMFVNILLITTNNIIPLYYPCTIAKYVLNMSFISWICTNNILTK